EPGKGTRFTVNLRFRTAAVPKAADEKYAETFVFRDKVWIVDDDPFILQYCSSVFEKHHINFTSFQMPSELLNAAIDEDLRVIFMDMRMPQMNGPELFKQMRKKLPDVVKIVALTAQALPEEREEILNDGFDALLMKPF